MTKLLSNVDGSSHWDDVARTLMDCDEALFVAPFIFDDFSNWLERCDFRAVRKFTLVTTLAPVGDDQLKKPAALLSLLREMRKRSPKTKVTIQIDNLLHGKIYLFKKEEVLTRGIVTSANLTHSGFRNKHEWGLLIEDALLLKSIQSQINACVEYPLITEDVLEMMAIFVDQYRRNHPYETKNVDVDASLFNALKMAPIADRLRVFPGWENVGKVFLKPRGDRNRPILKADQEKFGDETGTLAFPKGRPGDVRIGDVVVTFGTGDRCVLSVHRVLSDPIERTHKEQSDDPDAMRWPWYVHAENFTPKFGNTWWTLAVTVDSVVADFLRDNSQLAVTDAGGQSLGSFNFGAGRLLLSMQFGRFLADRIMAVERQL